MTPNVYDQACRYLLKLAPLPLLRWFLRLPAGRFEFVDWLDARQVPWPGQPDRTCDTVAHLRDSHKGGEPWAVVVEFQIDPDELMFGRALKYLGDLWMACKPTDHRGDRFQVGLAAVNLRGFGKASRDMALEGTDIFTNLGVGDRNLSKLSAMQVLKLVEAGVVPRAALAFVPLFQGGDDPGIISEWQRLADQEADVESRRALGLAIFFAEAAACRPLWKEALKEFNMIESKTWNEWTAKAELNGRAKALQSAIEARFDAFPPDIATTIKECDDADKLDRWLRRAVKINSLDDLRRELT